MNPDEIFELVEKYKKKRKDTRATIPSVNLAGRRELVDRLMQIPTRSTYQSSGYTTTEEDIAPVLTTSDEEELLSGMTPTQRMYHMRSGGFVDTSTSWGDKVNAVSKMILEGKDPDYAQTDTMLKQLQAQQERYKTEDVNSDSEQVELHNYYNQLWTAKYQDVLSKTKMDGQNHSIAEELKIITELSGDEKKKRKEAVIKKMEELGIPAENYALFTDDKNFSWGTFGKWLGANVDAGLNTLYSQYASTGDLLFGNILEGIGWENNPFTLADKYYEGAAAAAKTRLDLYAERLGGAGWNTAGEFGTATIAAVPEAIMWYWSAASKAGTVLTTSSELAANAAMQAGDFLEKAGLTVSKMMQNPKYWLSFAKTFGSDYDESKEKGMSDSKAVVSAVGKSLLNAVWENGLDGGSGIQGLADDLANGAKGLRAWFDSSVEEGLEEGIQKFTSETIDYVAGDRETEIYNPVEYLKEIAMGTGVGAVLGGGQIAADAVRNSHYQHQANKLTADEQTVLDKVVEEYVAEQEKEGKKLTASEKATFKKNAEAKLRKGYITPEKIEEILGGDDYANYKAEMDAFKQSEDFVAYHNATQEKTKLADLEKQLEDLKNAPNTVGNSKAYDALQSKIEDIKEGRTENELLTKIQPERARVADLRNQMRSKVRDRVKGTRLAESYQELERRNQKPNLDPEKYTNESAKTTVQNIKDSGLGDGTNEFADRVDFLANMSAKSGSVFKLMTEQEMKDANLWPKKDDGSYVEKNHGCVAPDGTIVLNYNSDRNWIWTVGHEVGHVVENTKYSKALRNALFNHAIAKEGIEKFNEMLKEKEYSYKGRTNTTPEIELANDLLGEYVFSDYEFVSNLAKTNRNLFQKMFDEVKHLYNMAVAGSKQQRELEKAKYLFQKALEEVEKGQKNTTENGGVKNSLNIKRTDGTVEELADARSLTPAQAVDYLYQAKAGKIRRDSYIPVRKDTPQVIIDTLAQVNEKIDNSSMVMKVKKAVDSMKTEDDRRAKKYGDNVRKHGLTPEQIIEIINNLDDPTTIIYETNRYDSNGKKLPNAAAVFVNFEIDGREGLAVVEFENPRDTDAVGLEYGDTNYHTVVTVFEPDTERNDMPYDHIEELLSDPNNYELKIIRRQAEESVTGANQPNTSNELPSNKVTIAQSDPKVNSKFSMSKTVEETKDLVALHNLTAEKLLKSLELGGLPMPSIAITKAYIPHDNFGEITLIMGKDTIDPKANKKNVVYSADAWTPTFPSVEYETDINVERQINNRLLDLASKVEDVFKHDIDMMRYSHEDNLNRHGGEEGLIQYAMEKYGLKAAYLEDKGKHIEKVTEQVLEEKKYNTANTAKYEAVAAILGVNDANEVAKLNIRETIEQYGDQLEAIYPGITQTAMRTSRLLSLVKAYLEDQGGEPVYRTVTDEKAMRKAVDEAIDMKGFEAWTRELFAGIVRDKGIYNNKDLFTPSGNRKSFKQTHLPFTLENIVKAMASQNNGNTKNVSGFNGIKTLRAGTAERFKSIAAMHERKGRLQHLTQAEADQINDDLSSRLYNIMETIDNENGNKGSSNSFIRLDSIGETLMEISEGGKYNVSDIQGVFAKYGHAISDDLAADIKQLLYDVSQMPVNIYEAKPERAVTFDEVGVFVIPRNADIKLKQELLNRGYAIAEYDPEVEGDRNKVVNQFEEYKFSLSDASEQTPRQRGAFNELWSDFGRTDTLDDFAPVAENVAPVAEDANVSAPVADVDDGFDRESFEAITDDDAPPVVEDEPVKEIKTAQDKLDAKIASTQAELDKNRQLREQSARDYDEEIAEQQRKYDSKKNKNSIAANDILRRIERLKRLKATNDANYEKRISDLEARVEKMSSPEYRTAEQRRSKMEQYTEMWKNMIGDTSTWKDLAMGISYKTKTMRRFLRKVVRGADGKANIALADQIYDELETKYDHNEAQLKQESVKLKEVFKKLNLNHAEDTYAHMLGELRHNPQTTLTEDAVKEFYEKNKGKIDSAKVEKAITEARSTFDSLLIRVNNVLREQGMKEIPFRKGYFPHFTNPKQGWLAKLLNWKTVDTEIPTSIAGLTEQFDPQRSWQGFNKQREGDTTDYSLYQGLDTYIHGALDWIYHIEDLQKRRSLENYIRYVHSEEGVKAKIEEIKANEYYDADEAQKQIELVLAEAANPLNNLVTELRARTNTLANKKASMDRGMEEATNRKIYSVMTNLNNRINANMVVGSFSSALTNFIPIAQSWHQVSPYYTVQGLGDMVRNAVKDDGMVAKSDFLTNRLVEEEKLYQTGWDKVADKAAFVMNAIDHITSQTVWRSKYLQNLHEGMSETQAIKDADQFAKNLMAGRSRGNAPSIFDAKNPAIKLATAFQLEVANQYGYMFEDVPQDTKSPLRLVKGYTTAILGAYLYNAVFSSLTGRDAAFDPMGIIEDLLRDLGIGDDDDDDEEVDVGDALLNLGENIIQEMPYVGGFFGGGRVPVSSALPYSSDSSPIESLVKDVKKGWNEGDFTEGNWTPFVKEMLKPLYYLALPVGGGQLKKTIDGLSMFSDDHPVSGSYTDNGELRFPVEDTLGNKIQAALFGQYASEDARYYFDNDLAPLSEKQLQEYQDVDIPIRDYWEYREGLKGLAKAEEKVAYINDLDLPISKKNILVNNQLDRKKKIDLTNYGDFDSLAEFDFANENPEKYDFFESIGVSYKDYANADKDGKAAYNWAFENPEKYTVSKVVTDDLFEYKQYTNDLNDIQADKDSSGKDISGSAKNKKIDYINGLNIEYGAKLILFKDAYPSDDTYNKDIIDYLNGRSDLSYDERVTILKELGFTVKNGKVYWD